jgi:hypothetical protein
MDPGPIIYDYGTLAPRVPKIWPPFENLRYLDNEKAENEKFVGYVVQIMGLK